MYLRRTGVALAFSFATLLNHADACRCLVRELCDIFDAAEIVLRATVLSRRVVRGVIFTVRKNVYSIYVCMHDACM